MPCNYSFSPETSPTEGATITGSDKNYLLCFILPTMLMDGLLHIHVGLPWMPRYGKGIAQADGDRAHVGWETFLCPLIILAPCTQQVS